MGNKIIFALALGLFSNFAHANYDFDLDLNMSRNETGYSTQRINMFSRMPEIGPAFSKTWWSGQQSFNSNGLGFSTQKYFDNISIEGYAVYHRANNNKTFVESDLWLKYSFNKEIKILLGLNSDTYSNDNIAPGDINWTSVLGAIEWDGKDFGSFVGYRYLNRTDNSEQYSIHTKLWWKPVEAGTIYIFAKDFNNTIQSTLYFSPRDHLRYGIGGVYAIKVGSGAVRFNLEAGQSSVDGDKSPTLVYSVKLDQRISSSSKVILTLGRDYSTIGNYDYKYLSLLLKTSF